MPTLEELIAERARLIVAAPFPRAATVAEAEQQAREQWLQAREQWLQQQAAQAQGVQQAYGYQLGQLAQQGVQQGAPMIHGTETASWPRTAAEIAEENARRMNAAAAQNYDLNRELQAQRDIRIDPEINRIAEIFFSALMRRVDYEFQQHNPVWEELGAREKKLWLEATEILLDELKKDPIPKNALSIIANRRIIAD